MNSMLVLLEQATDAPSVGGELTVSVFQSTPALALTTLTSCSSCRFVFAADLSQRAAVSFLLFL